MNAVVTLIAGIYMWWFYTRDEHEYGAWEAFMSGFGFLIFWYTLIRVFIWGAW